MKMRYVVVLAVFLGSVMSVSAHEEHDMKTMPPHTTSKEFDQLKQLVGHWTGSTSDHAKGNMPSQVSTSFRLTSAGSTVEETLFGGTPHEMIDMYHDEGGKLAMTHYCAIGNRPHMVLKNANSKQITLEMTAATPGIDAAKDMHMHALTLEFPDADHLIEKWTSYQNGKPAEVATFNFVRNK